MDFQSAAIAIAATFLGAVVKGVSGMGLPLVAIPFMASAIDVPTAMALLTLPILASNLWQAAHPVLLRRTVKRFWTLLVPLVLGIVFASRALVAWDEKMLSMAVGAMIVLAALASGFHPRSVVPPRHERWLSPAIGIGSGLIGGVTSFFGPPVAVYMMSLGLGAETFIVAISVAYVAGVVPLNLAMIAYGIFGWGEALLSALLILPVMGGMAVGRRLRHRVSATLFRRIVLAVLVLSGLNMLRRGL